MQSRLFQTRFVLVIAVMSALTALGVYVFVARLDDQQAIAANPEQIRALADSMVTIEEYNQAVANTVACAEASGFRVELFPRDRLRPTTFVVAAPDNDGVADKATADAAQKTMAACCAEHLWLVAEAWHAQHEPSSAELGALYDGLENCVAQGGVPSQGPRGATIFVRYGNEPRTMDIAADALAAYGECAWEFWARTGLQAPVPAVMR